MSVCTQNVSGANYDHLIEKHPCFHSGAHNKFGRIHLPVCPSCNIQCRFCLRKINKKEKRPGVSSALLTPAEAVRVLDKALKLCPEITVVGIAGPGDTLYSSHAIDTFRLVHRKYPHLINCLSTNGLLLREKAETLAEAGVKTISVTVNALDAGILSQICSYIIHDRQYMTGEIAARWLILAQLAGIKKAVECEMTVKVNTVLIPGVNDRHIADVAKGVAEVGARFINIIPLIPQHEFRDKRPPSCQELNAARAAAEQYLPVFRHCRQCRADACGVPGSGIDFADRLYKQRAETFSHG